ncbi:MAG: methylated-DNA--[protein]-cysteine S-methyltransferase [Rikenellaceae bacterium]
MSKIYKSLITTPVGEMVSLTSSDGVVAFIHTCRVDYNRIISRFCTGNEVINGDNEHSLQLHNEIDEYFRKERKTFGVKCVSTGTPFQNRAWDVLREIPFGSVITYREQAIKAGSPNGYRAVGRANSKNIIEIVIPCHRVVAHGVSIGGFASGVDIKQRLLNHEKK